MAEGAHSAQKAAFKPHMLTEVVPEAINITRTFGSMLMFDNFTPLPPELQERRLIRRAHAHKVSHHVPWPLHHHIACGDQVL